jgi:hypothetical protein
MGLIIKKAINMIIKYFYDIRYFGYGIAHYNFWGEFANLNFFTNNINNIIKKKRYELTIKFLQNEYKDLINEYKHKKIIKKEYKKIIWCCWWQGEQNMPEIVKMCVDSIKKNKGIYKLIIITKENYKKYVTIPDIIVQKLDKNIISITHFSDILRMKLLSQYGGIWVDATMYFFTDIFKQFNYKELNSNCLNDEPFKEYDDRWCGFFIGGIPNKLFSFVYDLFIINDTKYNKLINYFLIDYAIHLAYLNFSDCKKLIDNINIHNNDIFNLVKVFNDKYEEDKYLRIIKSGFFKLTYKKKFDILTKKGDITNFGYFIRKNSKSKGEIL